MNRRRAPPLQTHTLLCRQRGDTARRREEDLPARSGEVGGGWARSNSEKVWNENEDGLLAIGSFEMDLSERALILDGVFASYSLRIVQSRPVVFCSYYSGPFGEFFRRTLGRNPSLLKMMGSESVQEPSPLILYYVAAPCNCAARCVHSVTRAASSTCACGLCF